MIERMPEKTLSKFVAERFARPEVVQPTKIEINGTIVGGVIVIRGEHEFDKVMAIFPARKKEGK